MTLKFSKKKYIWNLRIIICMDEVKEATEKVLALQFISVVFS